MANHVMELMSLARTQVGAAYVFGAWGGMCTPQYRRKYAGYTPEKAEKIKRACPVMSGRQSACAPCQYEGRRAFDCRGFTHWALKTAGVIELEGQGATGQWKGDNWEVKGDVSAMLELKGLVVFKGTNASMSHTGLYMGSGEVIHARGHAYGVEKSTLSKCGFTHFASPRGLYTPDEIAAATPGKENSMQTLRKGDRGAAVETMQNALDALGYAPGALDGIYGAKTVAAVQRFQMDNTLHADGICGAKTWEALNRLLEAQKDEGVKQAQAYATKDELNALRQAMDAVIADMQKDINEIKNRE